MTAVKRKGRDPQPLRNFRKQNAEKSPGDLGLVVVLTREGEGSRKW